MHVLVTADTLGGVWTYTRELVTALTRRGHRVTLVSFGEIPRLEQTDWMLGIENLDYRPTGFRLEWMQDCAGDLECSAEYLLNVIDEVKPDLIHLSQYGYGSLPCSTPKVVVAHSDVVGWWQAVHGCDPKPSVWMREYRHIVRTGLQQATAVVAPSRAMLESLERNYGSLRRSAVIPNGSSPESLNPYLSKEPFAISAGRVWDLGKNTALLTYIDSPWLIYLAGDNQHPDKMVSATAALHTATGRVIFKGQQSEHQMRHLLARASVYIATSQYEPFGLAPLEAAFSRCAILASDIASFREVWGDAALYFESANPASLEAQLKELAGSREMCATYGKLAYERARRLYKTSTMVDKYLELYQTLVPAEVMAA